jgi:Ca2+-transporting ATPase
LLLMLAVLYIEQLQPIFKTVALNWQDWFIVLIFAGIPTFLMGLGSLLSKPSKRKPVRYGTTKMITR